MTGSPRSSARQYRPASNSALDRYPRSSRSASSPLNVSFVARFGSAERGIGGYAVSRALQIRRLRRPVPGVERGQAPR